MPDQGELKVQCKCGWTGKVKDLDSHAQSDDKACPKCGALFMAWPPKRF